MIGITPLHILLMLLQSWAAAAAGDQSASSPPAAPPLAQLHDTDTSFVPIAVALGCILLFVGFFTIYLWYCADTSFAAAVRDPTRAFTTCCSCGPHGIDRKILDTFPILTYSTITHLKPRIVPLECAVCLSEFIHHDTLRLLPKCNHAFHRDCIDKWLALHVTCPVCRTRLSNSSFHHHYHHRGDNEEVIATATMMIPNNEENNAHPEVDESFTSRMNYALCFGEASVRSCHTTGHSLGVGLPSDNMSQQIPANYVSSASDGGSRERLGHSLTPPFVSQANVFPSTSSSSPQHIALQFERRSI